MSGLRRARPHGGRLSFWVFLLTGVVLRGFRPETDGLDGIKALVRARFPDVPQLSTAALAAWLADSDRAQPRLLDVRLPDEFAVSHLDGARRVSPSARGNAVAMIAADRRPVVVYCAVGYRSSAVARRLIRAGAQDVFNLEGSIFQWANEGRALVDARGRTTAVHPYHRRWRRLLDAGASRSNRADVKG